MDREQKKMQDRLVLPGYWSLYILVCGVGAEIG